MNIYEKQVGEILNAADSSSPIVKAAFLSVMDEIRKNYFDAAAIEIALANGDVNGVIAATGIDHMDDLLFGIGMNNNAYIFTQQLNNIWALGASVAISQLSPNAQKILAFDTIGERAINFLRSNGARSVTNLSVNSRAGVITAIERTLRDGVNPTKQAKYIRQLIGLTPDQVVSISNFRAQLETRSQLGFTPAEDRRLSAVDQAVVRRHMKEGYLNDSQIDDLVEKYRKSSLNKRATDISRTESLNSIHAAQKEVWEQGLDQGVLNDSEDRKFWIVTRDDKLRPTHAVIPGMNPDGVKIRSQFITPYGPVDHPGTFNAGFINCRCCVVLGWYGQQYHSDGYLTV